MKKLTSAAQRKLDRFDAAAQSWGWQADQGYGNQVNISEAEYVAAKTDLSNYIASLQTKRSK